MTHSVVFKMSQNSFYIYVYEINFNKMVIKKIFFICEPPKHIKFSSNS